MTIDDNSKGLKSKEGTLCSIYPVKAGSGQGGIVHVCSQDRQLQGVESPKERVNTQTEEQYRASSAHVKPDKGRETVDKTVGDLSSSGARGPRPLKVASHPNWSLIQCEQESEPREINSFECLGEVDQKGRRKLRCVLVEQFLRLTEVVLSFFDNINQGLTRMQHFSKPREGRFEDCLIQNAIID